MPTTLEMTLRNKKAFSIKKKKYVQKFPIQNLDYPNMKEQNDLKFHYQF